MPAGGADGLKATQIAYAAKMSMESGRPVKLSEVGFRSKKLHNIIINIYEKKNRYKKPCSHYCLDCVDAEIQLNANSFFCKYRICMNL